MEHVNIEKAFISLVVESCPQVIVIENAMKFLDGMESFQEHYELWCVIKDRCLDELFHSPIIRFKTRGERHKLIVHESELMMLQDKLKHDELSLLQVIHEEYLTTLVYTMWWYRNTQQHQ